VRAFNPSSLTAPPARADRQPRRTELHHAAPGALSSRLRAGTTTPEHHAGPRFTPNPTYSNFIGPSRGSQIASHGLRVRARFYPSPSSSSRARARTTQRAGQSRGPGRENRKGAAITPKHAFPRSVRGTLSNRNALQPHGQPTKKDAKRSLTGLPMVLYLPLDGQRKRANLWTTSHRT